MSDDASKKAAGPAAAASASTGGASPVSPLVIPSTNSYVIFSLLLFPLMITTYTVYVDVLGYHLPVCCMSSMRMFVNLGNCFVMIYTWIKLMRRLLIISTLITHVAEFHSSFSTTYVAVQYTQKELLMLPCFSTQRSAFLNSLRLLEITLFHAL